MGGLLTLPSFVETFPEIDVTDAGTRGLDQSQKNHKSTIQGKLFHWSVGNGMG